VDTFTLVETPRRGVSTHLEALSPNGGSDQPDSASVVFLEPGVLTVLVLVLDDAPGDAGERVLLDALVRSRQDLKPIA
jgi:hypothetical protein